MKTNVRISITLLLLLVSSCGIENTRKKVFFINSYHSGYGSSDDVMQGFFNKMPSDSFEIETFFMDTKRNNDELFMQKKVKNALDSIEMFSPDIIVASDDNAIKYIIEPHFNNREMPIVFCGVNWSAEQYNLQSNHITGMLEVLPLKELLEMVKINYPDAIKLLVLTENTTSARNNKILLDTLFQTSGFTTSYELVDDFETWKDKFLSGNQMYDLIYIPTNGAIKGWNKDEAIQFVKKHIEQPVITCDDFMMPYAVFGLTKIASEQGEWAAQVVKEILYQDKSIDDFPISRNKESKAWVNTSLAEIIGFNADNLNIEKINEFSE